MSIVYLENSCAVGHSKALACNVWCVQNWRRENNTKKLQDILKQEDKYAEQARCAIQEAYSTAVSEHLLVSCAVFCYWLTKLMYDSVYCGGITVLRCQTLPVFAEF